MKISKLQLKQIIQEELKILQEEPDPRAKEWDPTAWRSAVDRALQEIGKRFSFYDELNKRTDKVFDTIWNNGIELEERVETLEATIIQGYNLIGILSDS